MAAVAGDRGSAGVDDVVLGAMQAELQRNAKGLHLDGYERPYYISYRVVEEDRAVVGARDGAVWQRGRERSRRAFVDVRVGSSQLDNTEDREGESFQEMLLYQPAHDLPIDDARGALRRALWRLTDQAYKQALAAWQRVRARRVYAMEATGKRPSLSREPVARYVGPLRPCKVDLKHWTEVARALSGVVASNDEILDSNAVVETRCMIQRFVDTEGRRIREVRVLWGVHVTALAQADDGMLLNHSVDFYAPSVAQLPKFDSMIAATRHMVDELLALRQAPVFEPYTGPAILLPRAAGVVFHEAVGHRLEGQRQDEEEEGRTFAGKVGQRVLPATVSVFDDPTLRQWRGTPLNGFYRFDEEGIAAQRVTLIDHGVLKSFLMSRRPVEGFVHSNGHGRAEGIRRPVARMGNTIVQVEHPVSPAELETMLLAMVRKQGKPYGLIIADIQGGSTNTSTFGYQAFKGLARMVYRLDAKTGRKTLVRGVEIVGTPLSSINKIVAASTQEGVFNGYCGAESGMVPVSTVAPAILFKEIELQRSTTTKQRPPVLAPPSNADSKSQR